MDETLTVPAKKVQPLHDIPFISKPNEISNEEYHNSEQFKEFCSSSVLKLMMVSPKYARYCLDHPEKRESEAMSQGSVYHSMLASLTNKGDLSEFENEYFTFDPPKNLSTGKPYGWTSKAYQEAMQAETESHEGKSPCSADENHTAQSMIDELLNGNPHLSKTVQHLIKIGSSEQSHFLEYQGQKFKYRPDLKTSKKILDWKKTRIGYPKPEKWDREIIKYDYHISAAFYQFFEFLLTGKWKDFYWITQEDEPPFDFLIHSAAEWTYDIDHSGGQIVEMNTGALMLTKLLDYWIRCCERGQWPGYSIFLQPDWKNQRIGYPSVPGFYERNDFNFYD